MKWIRRSLYSVLPLIVGGMIASVPSPAADLNSPEYWKTGYEKMARMGRGYLVWETNRSGRWRIWRMELDGSNPRQLTRDEADRDHYCPHISPDGRRIAYLSYPKEHNTYEDFNTHYDATIPLHLISADGRYDRVIAPNARAYGEDRGVVWLNDEEVVYIGGDYQTYRLNVGTGEQSLLLKKPGDKELPWLINPQLRYATSGNPVFAAYDSKAQTVQEKKPQEGCQPYFSRNGVWGFWMGGAGGPINRYRLDTGEVSPILERVDPRMPKERHYLYFPMLSSNGRLFTFAASPEQHDHFTSDYDIFVAPIDPKTLELTGNPVRYTFDPGDDRFPDVFLADSEAGNARKDVAIRAEAQTPPPSWTARADANEESGAWPPSREGLVFLWETAKAPNRVSSGGVDRLCTVSARGKARFNRNQAMTISDGAYVADESAPALLNACKRTNRLTLEATFVPGNRSQKGPARIVSFSTDAGTRNFTLGQEGDQLVFRLRTPATGENGYNPQVTLFPLEAGRPVHVIVTYEPGRLICYKNGEEVFRTDQVRGDFSNWTPQHLLFGDEWNGEREWAGALEGIAIYNRALAPEEAARHFRSYEALMRSRKPAPRLVVDAVLTSVSKIPTLKEIQPYKNALALYDYRVEKVVSGRYEPGTLRVAHWVILNGETLPVAGAKPGRRVRLTLEPFEANPQLASHYLSDTLPEKWDLTPYFDLGTP